MSFPAALLRIQNAVRTRLEPLSEQAGAAWRQRTAREQTLLRAGAIVFAAALLWLIGLQPALKRVQYAQQQLPLLQAQASRLDAMILEAKALDRGRSGVMSVEETEQALRSSLASSGLDSVSQFHTEPDMKGAWRIAFTQAPANRLVEWLSRLPYVAQLKVDHVDLARSNVDGRDLPGQLTGVVIMAMPVRGAP